MDKYECDCEDCIKPLTLNTLKQLLSVEISCDDGSGEITVSLCLDGKEFSAYSTYFEHTSSETTQAIDDLKYRTT